MILTKEEYTEALPVETKVFKHTAVLEGKTFTHFGIHAATSDLYGHKPEEIIDIELTISKDQGKPPMDSNNNAADYWGWYDCRKKCFTMIYAQRFLLGMCFGYGIEAAENSYQGKAYRLEVNIKKG